ncbi:SpoIIE family protein phosphatase [Streptomyces sp. NPDC079189]|uniref:SpoIIE family protein phosphatase n=1 Tax=Streptomyces sp. NPDC079189 TaxID=3154514 RepID=UPI00341942F2
MCESYRSYRSRSRGLALVIGDVQGHGVAAAATMSQLRSVVRAFALSGHDPQEVVSGTPAAHRPRPFLTSVRK